MGVLMKRFAVATVIAATFSISAFAADMPVKASAFKASPVSFTWTGFYAGLNAGYGWGHSNIFEDCQDCVPNPIFQMGTFDPKGFIGGGQLGYNYQMSNFVLGAEVDMDYFNGHATGIGLNNGYIQDVRYRWFATARGRLGVALDRTLFYATGGAAFANIFHSSLNPSGAEGSTTRTGWVVGGGLEHAFTNHWTAKVEYLYADLGTTILHGTFTPPRPIYFDYKDRVQFLRFGVNYLFNGP